MRIGPFDDAYLRRSIRLGEELGRHEETQRMLLAILSAGSAVLICLGMWLGAA